MQSELAGHDDAIALMLACKHDALDIQGVSTVACNQSVDKTTVNALSVLDAIGHGDVVVHKGQAKPLMAASPVENVYCPEVKSCPSPKIEQ